MRHEKLYSLQEVAEILQVTRQTLYNNIKSGRLNVNKIGNVYRVTEEQLQDIIENGYK